MPRRCHGATSGLSTRCGNDGMTKAATTDMEERSSIQKMLGNVADLGEQCRRGGSLLRWLDDDRIAGSERRRHLPTHQQQWQDPRRDHGYDAERLVHCVVEC